MATEQWMAQKPWFVERIESILVAARIVREKKRFAKLE
jgi:hypothetical protein